MNNSPSGVPIANMTLPLPLNTNNTTVTLTEPALTTPANAKSRTTPAPRMRKPKPTQSKKKRRIESDTDNKYHIDQDSEGRDDNEVFCLCRKPDDGTVMIGCDHCDEWFHAACINFSNQMSRLVVSFSCPSCTAAGRGETKWKRHCRLPGCKELVTKPAKFCSREHGIKFYKDIFSGSNRRLAVTQGEIKALVNAVKSAEEFKSLGNARPEDTDHPEEDKKLISEYKLQADQARAAMESWKRREAYIVLTKEQTKRLGELAAQDSGVKKKDICGYDYRLSQTSTEWSEWENSDQGKAILSGQTPLLSTVEEFSNITGVCLMEKRKCLRHTAWQMLTVDECLLEQHSHQAEIDEANRKIDDIKRLHQLDRYLISRQADQVQFL
ncbi:hypothetical protein NADFUDRAFT_52629 [Nadsonia fulvescens var. elongata DSM 6958]|uniref:PHD-type domain-containing protein n=1 Tax=Nadsonia fulvescens var. elongata DSM 6958 TaxID=857566 RepID=A0A1E3PFX4_9ASCO|nr:hypothetical protein NADFUDRAFT_52629 [Nadsonia fulvescens var. elongata DSM 6958]